MHSVLYNCKDFTKIDLMVVSIVNSQFSPHTFYFVIFLISSSTLLHDSFNVSWSVKDRTNKDSEIQAMSLIKLHHYH